LTILYDSLVVVDGEDGLARYLRLAERFGPAAAAPAATPDQPTSRFGMTRAELERAVGSCAMAGPVLRFEGFSFHHSCYSVAQRADLAGVTIRWCREASERGLPAGSLSISGGFAVNYVAAVDWQ
jgi:diaminopimelate decarboxylase